MTAPLKPIPQDATTLPTIREYQTQCDSLATKLKKKPLNLADAILTNRVNGDGTFQILNQDPKNDFYCGAEVNWKTRSMQVKAGLFSDLKRKRPRLDARINEVQRIPDACTLTRSLAGDAEIGAETCNDGQMDPRLHDAQVFESAQFFLNRCTQLQDDAAIMSNPAPVNFTNVRIVNENAKDGEYSLVYENPMDNFFCEGYVDTNQHAMFLRHGRLDEQNTDLQPQESLEMKDACSMTEGLLGKDELIGTCQDRTKKERDLEAILTKVGFGIGGILGNWALYKLVKKFLLASVGTGGLPVWRHLAMGYAAASVYDGVAGLFLPKNHPVRKYGIYAAGATGLVFPNATRAALVSWVPQTLRKAVATRLAAATSGRFVFLRGAGRIAGGMFAVAVVNYAWRRWVTGSDYQSYVNKRVADEVYEKDNVYGVDGWDLLVVPAAIKLLRGGSRWIAPDMMNSGITSDNESIENKYLAEDRKNSEEAEAFLKEVLPPLLSSETGQDPNAVIAMLRDGPITLNEREKEASQLLFEKGAAAVAQKYNLNEEKVEQLALAALLQKVQEAAAYMVFVDQDRNDWARELFNKDGTLKAKWDGDVPFGPQTLPAHGLTARFPYTAPPEPEAYWLDLTTGEKIPAIAPVPKGT